MDLIFRIFMIAVDVIVVLFSLTLVFLGVAVWWLAVAFLGEMCIIYTLYIRGSLTYFCNRHANDSIVVKGV